MKNQTECPSIRSLTGVGEQRAKYYEKLGVEDLCSLLRYYPRTWMDFSNPVPILHAQPGETVCVQGTVFRKQGEQRIRKGLSLFKVYVTDGEGQLTVTIFNNIYAYQALELEHTYCFYGKITGGLLRREMNSPQVLDPDQESAIRPVYPLTQGLTNKMICTNMRQALKEWGDHLEDVLPEWVLQKYGLCRMRYAYENIHFPADRHALELSRRRLIFEEFFLLSLGMGQIRSRRREHTAFRLADTDLTPFLQQLPFSLTEGQSQAIADCIRDCTGEVAMNRLVQGDVGCGKTVVAAALCYLMAKNGGQAAMMAPTELLARQHLETLTKMLSGLGISCGLLVGSQPAAQRRETLKQIAAGEIQVVVGTQALIQQGVEFARLGLVITDEQHRFGVEQRSLLSQKGEHPHCLVMSATPIPRTLALMMYGELDLSVIRQMPKGRKPVKTWLIDSGKRTRALGFVRDFLDKGFQGYIVCPMIEETDSELVSLKRYQQGLRGTPLEGASIGFLHGKMKGGEKEGVMEQFAQGKLQLLVSTTVVEVGVDVPNAVVMVVENAERFGLSQLHQLRGRVGRGSQQSHCILISDNRQPTTRTRLKLLCQTNDGFELAQQDLKLRGPGDFFGRRQHGLPQLKMADFATDLAQLEQAREAAQAVLEEDPGLRKPEHRLLREEVERMFAAQTSN